MAPTPPPAGAGEGDQHLHRNKQAGTPSTRLVDDLLDERNEMTGI
jgi:hypothetical protein